jgi:hypothetical protein
MEASMHAIPALTATSRLARAADEATTRATEAVPAPQIDGSPPATPSSPLPKLMLDPALNLLVLEFQDATGEVNSIPSARQLAAYRAGQQG